MVKILVGLFIGALCGVVPLIFGLISELRFLSIIGILSTAVSGLIFSLLEKSPFTSIGVAIVFVVVMFAQNKKKKTNNDINDHDEYMDDE